MRSFSSNRRWSAVQFVHGTFYLGAPGRISAGPLAPLAEQRQKEGRRVLSIASGDGAVPSDPGELPPTGLKPWGLVVLAEQLRPNVTDTIAFVQNQGVEIKVSLR